MRPRLVLRLPSGQHDPVRWVALDAAGVPEGPSERGSRDEAATRSGGREVVGLASGLDLLLLPARIPTQSRQRLQQAVPYALEDQLAQDIEALHFTMGARDAAGDLWVAVVERAMLDGWLHAAAGAGIECDQIVPELPLIPVAPGGWSLLVEADRFTLRTGPHGGLAGDPENLDTLLALALSEARDGAPQALHVYEATPPPAPIEPEVAELSREPVEDATALLARQLPASPLFNLRHGDYARARAASAHWRRWRLVAALAGLWLVTDLTAAGLQQWRLAQRSDALRDQIEAEFRRAFPDAGRLIDPRGQMESRLAALRGGGGTEAAGFLELLGRVGPTLSSAESVEIAALAFRSGDLELEISADTLQRVDALKQRLEGLGGLTVEVRSARSEGDRVQGRLQISAGGGARTSAAPVRGGRA